MMLAQHRWTVDTPEDFELVSRIIGALYPSNPAFGLADIVALLERHPDWSGINAHVVQKTVTTN
jgi:spore coat polysaccharide biosynthesis protein SpsF